MLIETIDNLNNDKRKVLKKHLDAIHSLCHYVDFNMVIGALQRQILSHQKFGQHLIGTVDEQTLRSLYDELYGPFVEWTDEMVKPECVEDVKQPFAERHERIQKMYNLEMEAA